MITFKQWLHEQEDDPVLVEDFTHMIERDCADFFEKSGRTGFLYRGMQPSSAMRNGAPTPVYEDPEGGKLGHPVLSYVKKTVRADRRPSDMSRERQKLVDDWMEKKFGVRPRSQSLFCFNRESGDSVDYGNKYIILPIGPIEHAIWSPHYEDLYHAMDREPMFSAFETDEEDGLKEYLDHFLKVGEYEDDLKEAIHYVGDREVMLSCSSYFAFPEMYHEELYDLFLAPRKKRK